MMITIYAWYRETRGTEGLSQTPADQADVDRTKAPNTKGPVTRMKRKKKKKHEVGGSTG